MPALNESENLRWLLPRINEVLPTIAERFDVVIVDDGSTDGTGAVAQEVARGLGMTLRVVRHERRMARPEMSRERRTFALSK